MGVKLVTKFLSTIHLITYRLTLYNVILFPKTTELIFQNVTNVNFSKLQKDTFVEAKLTNMVPF